MPRIESTDGFTVHRGIEARVIFFGFEHADDELRYSDVSGANPFQDPRVRQAVYHAINADAIVERIMRGNAQTSGLIISPAVRGFRADLNERLRQIREPIPGVPSTAIFSRSDAIVSHEIAQEPDAEQDRKSVV